MADDMGFSDIGPYGGEIPTPTLDQLAANGVCFRQFYNAARCCPTRASLLTGLYPHQAGIGHMMGDYGLDGYRGDLNKRCVTIAEVLQQAGYTTLMSGKWHVTPPEKESRTTGPASAASTASTAPSPAPATLQPVHADAGQRARLGRRSGLLLHQRHRRPRRAAHR